MQVEERIKEIWDRLWPVLFIVLGGCASIPPGVGQLDAGAASLELADTTFHAQERYQCGPAALLTALQSSGADASMQEVVDLVYLPGRKGSLQAEMLAAVRTSGRLPYRIDGTLNAIFDELRSGRPVVVLQNLGVSLYPRWHYAVVVGIDPGRHEVILRSGIDKRRVTAFKPFLHTWRRSDYWSFVVLKPDEWPANVDRVRYFETIAGVEQAGRYREALIGWQTALGQWPDDPVALFGFANVHYAVENWAEAVAGYQALLDAGGELPVARNNLAMAFLKIGETEKALDQVDRAILATEDRFLQTEFAKTREAILATIKSD
ncbi:MAG: PA2778 family cysteine peptidase [Gammaproteobacteria bacterium]|nr:PA2778 family cysteine peptidase [Gammaproteobacteria bacterium]NNC77250.1 PA2778 family cysteine peptidase [Woeseiaceae bacterium]